MAFSRRPPPPLIFVEVKSCDKHLQCRHGMGTLLTRERKCNYITVATWRDNLRWTWHDDKNRMNGASGKT